MEVKFIIYIIGGILYFFYKRAQDMKKNAAETPDVTEQTSEAPKPIKPPAYNPLDEARRELQRKQAAAEAQKKLSTPARQTLLTSPKADTGKDLFIREKKKATFGEGANDAPVYEEELPASANLNRQNIKSADESIYRMETMEEANALAESGNAEYEFDAKQAFIGSVIFERKY